MKSALVAGKSVKLVQFGVLVVRDKSPRLGRDDHHQEADGHISPERAVAGTIEQVI